MHFRVLGLVCGFYGAGRHRAGHLARLHAIRQVICLQNPGARRGLPAQSVVGRAAAIFGIQAVLADQVTEVSKSKGFEPSSAYLYSVKAS